MSIFGMMASPQQFPRGAFLGPASFSHVHGHSAEGTKAWFIATDLDDWPLGQFKTNEQAALWWMGAELVLAALRAHGEWP